MIEEVHQVCYKVYFRSFLARPSGKTYVFSLTISSIQSCVNVVADIDPLLERETWLPDVLVFPEVLTFPPWVFNPWRIKVIISGHFEIINFYLPIITQYL